jgi:hypothetical protein
VVAIRSIKASVRAWRGVLVLAAAGSIARAHAAEVNVAASTACADGGEVSFLAERALGRPLSDIPGPRFSIEIERRGGGFTARLETHAAADSSGAGVRSFRAPSCDELVETLGLAVAIALGVNPKASPPPAAPEHSTPTEWVAEASEPDRSPAAPGDHPQLTALGWVIGDSGSLPSPALGVGLGAALRWTALELRGGGLWLPARRGAPAGLPNGDGSPGAEIGLLLGSAQACAPLSLKTDAVELGVCAGWELGRMHATGTGVLRPYRKGALWSAPRVDLEARWAVPSSPVVVNLMMAALMPLQRDEFILSDFGSIHRAPNLVARAGVGLGWDIW